MTKEKNFLVDELCSSMGDLMFERKDDPIGGEGKNSMSTIDFG